VVDRGAWVRPFSNLVDTMPPYISSASDIAVVTGAICGALAAHTKS